MEDWIDRMADRLGQDHVSPEELGRILRLAREVAHGVERKLAPVSTYLMGVAVGRGMEAGARREGTLAEAMEKVRDIVPDSTSEAPTHTPDEPSDG